MGSSDLTLSPGDILRGTVQRVDASLDACFLDVGAHGVLEIPLAGVAGTTVAKLVPGACVCAQVTAPRRGEAPARAAIDIEFSGRLSVLVLDGTAITGDAVEAQPAAFVSTKVPGVRRAELSTRMERAFGDDACGLPSMLGAVNGPLRVVLRTASDDAPWDEVLSAVVVQVTEAAALTVLARADAAPALLMAEKPDADGDASIGTYGGAYTTAVNELNGRRIALACGGEVVFERTEAMWTAAVRVGASDAAPGDVADVACRVNAEGALAIAEAVVEYGVHGVLAARFVPGATADCFNDVVASLERVLEGQGTRISGDAVMSVVLIERRERIIP